MIIMQTEKNSIYDLKKFFIGLFTTMLFNDAQNGIEDIGSLPKFVAAFMNNSTFPPEKLA